MSAFGFPRQLSWPLQSLFTYLTTFAYAPFRLQINHTTTQKRKLGQRLHPVEHLPDSKLLVQKESLAQRCGDSDVTRCNASSPPLTDKVDFATLCYGLLR